MLPGGEGWPGLCQQWGHWGRVTAPPLSPWVAGDAVPLPQPGKDPVVPASAACGGTGSCHVSQAAARAWVGFGPAAPAGGAARWEQLRWPVFWGRGAMLARAHQAWAMRAHRIRVMHACWARAGMCHMAGTGLSSASRPWDPNHCVLPRLPPAPGAAGRVERVPSGGQGRRDPLPADAQRQLHQGHGR